MKLLQYIVLSIIICAFLGGACIEDGFTTSPSDQPRFSTDTLSLGTVFTEQPTVTSRFTVINPHGKQLSISDISISGRDAACFRINVDGINGERFSDVPIRGKDSIYVFVEATLPEGAQGLSEYEAAIDFTTNGVKSSVVLLALGQNVKRLRAEVLESDTRFTAELPYQVYDSLVVAPGATLTIEAGATIHFHDKAMLIVRGSLMAEGTVEQPVDLCGDRTGNVVGDISFDIMSRQWTGVLFTPTSTGNVLEHTDIRNTTQGVIIEGDGVPTSVPQLTLLNSRLHNSGSLVLESYHSSIRAVGCEFAEGADGLVLLHGGKHLFNHCTFANNYLFAAIKGAALQFSHIYDDEEIGFDDGSGLPYIEAEITNSIIYGIGADVSHGDLTGSQIFLRRTLLRINGEDDDNFIECIWGEDPLFYTIRNEYIFDYRLRPESPAIGTADASLDVPEARFDAYGSERAEPADIGAYVFILPDEDVANP